MADTDEFLPRRQFEGAKPGYVFTTREKGVGYYLDKAGTNEQAAPSFIPSDTFTGRKDGYVFKTGDQGLGYYKDVSPLERASSAPSASSAPTASSAPSAKRPAPGKVVIKSNKSIVKVPLPAATDAKRRKVGSADQDKPHYIKEMERYRSQTCSSDTKHERPLVK